MFKEQARAHPQLENLRQLLLLKSALQDFKLAVGPDGRNRALAVAVHRGDRTQRTVQRRVHLRAVDVVARTDQAGQRVWRWRTSITAHKN